jgi:hypothetical protein
MPGRPTRLLQPSLDDHPPGATDGVWSSPHPAFTQLSAWPDISEKASFHSPAYPPDTRGSRRRASPNRPMSKSIEALPLFWFWCGASRSVHAGAGEGADPSGGWEDIGGQCRVGTWSPPPNQVRLLTLLITIGCAPVSNSGVALSAPWHELPDPSIVERPRDDWRYRPTPAGVTDAFETLAGEPPRRERAPECPEWE